MTSRDLDNFCFSCLIDGGTEHNPISIEEARYTLECWKEEDSEIAADIAGLTPACLMRAWNAACKYLNHK